MKKIHSILLSMILLVPALTFGQEVHHSLKLELAMADMAGYAGLDGQRYLVEYRRTGEAPVGFVAGVSLGQTINEVMSDDPKVVNNPELIREGYNGSSIDVFTGANIDLFSTSAFSLPLGVGVSSRLRTESYPDPNGDLEVRTFTVDENWNRVYAVLTETIYEESVDLGFYGTISAGYAITEHVEFTLSSRYHFYNEGFSIFSTGMGLGYRF